MPSARLEAEPTEPPLRMFIILVPGAGPDGLTTLVGLTVLDVTVDVGAGLPPPVGVDPNLNPLPAGLVAGVVAGVEPAPAAI